MKPKRASTENARKIVLPILMQGFEKRRKLRSSAEEKFRSMEKLARDRQSTSAPRICTI